MKNNSESERERAEKLREPHARDTKATRLEQKILDRGSVPKDDDPQDAISEATDATSEAMAIDESFSHGPEIDLDNFANDEL
jgi:hypothetical protein